MAKRTATASSDAAGPITVDRVDETSQPSSPSFLRRLCSPSGAKALGDLLLCLWLSAAAVAALFAYRLWEVGSGTPADKAYLVASMICLITLTFLTVPLQMRFRSAPPLFPNLFEVDQSAEDEPSEALEQQRDSP